MMFLHVTLQSGHILSLTRVLCDEWTQTITDTIDFPALHDQLSCALTRIDDFPDINTISVRDGLPAAEVSTTMVVDLLVRAC